MDNLLVIINNEMKTSVYEWNYYFILSNNNTKIIQEFQHLKEKTRNDFEVCMKIIVLWKEVVSLLMD